MLYHHVIAKVGADKRPRELFTDLSTDELQDRFVKPYEYGKAFFCGHDLISPDDLRFVQIVATKRKAETERDEINRRDLEKIDELNRSSDSGFIVSAGRGYEPEDISEAGEDMTHAFIKGHPGFKANRWGLSNKIAAWAAGIVAAVAAAGLIKWLGWV